MNEQNSLLTNRWDKIGGAAMLPILKRYAQTYRDFPEMRRSDAYDSLQLSGSALLRWYELDPAGARSAIITEITRPRPRFGAKVLGILPDETLPEADLALAEHFAVVQDLDGLSNLASLIARYGSPAILPQVVEKLDPKIGKWASAIQEPLLAYVLRVNPALARPRIEQALASRCPGSSACDRSRVFAISEIRYDPVLEEIGIQSLEDPDPQVAMSAAGLLGKYGSSAAEAPLWRRYESWSAQWVGRESQLDVDFVLGSGERVDQLGLGRSLMRALATGKSWLSDKPQLQRIGQTTKVTGILQELDGYLKNWDDQTLNILVDRGPSAGGFTARLAQYECHSMDALEEKLAQFPSGTKFLISIPPVKSTATDYTLPDLLSFMGHHGLFVAGVKRPY
jgi:hypothetical protein